MHTQEYAGVHRGTHGYTGAHGSMHTQGYAGVQYTGVRPGTQGYTGVHKDRQGYTGVHRGTQGYTGAHGGMHTQGVQRSAQAEALVLLVSNFGVEDQSSVDVGQAAQ
jgi:hypothetical protein